LGLVYISQPALPKFIKKKPMGQHNFFSATPNSIIIILFHSKVLHWPTFL
jgi:hypothetical protein